MTLEAAADATAPTAGSGESEHVAAAAAETTSPAAAPEAPETEADPSAVDPAAPEAAAEPEEIEFDFGGNKLKLPKGAVPEELVEQLDKFTKGTWSDYTRKSQEIAAQRQAVEAERQVVQKLGTLRNDALSTYAEGLALRQDVQQLQQVDLNALWQSNPDQARRVSDALAQKQAQFQATVNKVSQIEAQTAAEEQQHVARLAEAGRAKVMQTVKGFDEAKVIDYAVKNYGLSEAEAKSWPMNPIGAVMAWKAMQFDALQAQAAKAAKPAAPQPPSQPVQPIRGKAATAAVDPDRMTEAQWLKWREGEIAKQRRR